MKRLYLIFVVLPLWVGCKEEGRIDHFDDNAPAPMPVEITSSEQIPGGVILRYELPADKNVRYVRAEYEIRAGVRRNAIASYMVDSLVLNGFGDTESHSATLYSVGRNEKRSEPISAEFNPGTPSIRKVTKTLSAGFGGVSVKVENPDRVNLAIVLYGDTLKMGYKSYLETFYTSASVATFNFRGLKNEEQDFSVFVRDRWGHTSDTISSPLTPLYEEYIAPTRWEAAVLAGDVRATDWLNPLLQGWDDIYTDWSGPRTLEVVTSPSVTFTVNLNATVKVSRLKLWHLSPYFYRSISIKQFKLYGAASTSGPWIPLGHFDFEPPSGNITTPTSEDIAFAQQGLDCEMSVTEFAPEPYTPIRFLRFEVIETYRGNLSPPSWFAFGEFKIWGQIIE